MNIMASRRVPFGNLPEKFLTQVPGKDANWRDCFPDFAVAGKSDSRHLWRDFWPLRDPFGFAKMLQCPDQFLAFATEEANRSLVQRPPPCHRVPRRLRTVGSCHLQEAADIMQARCQTSLRLLASQCCRGQAALWHSGILSFRCIDVHIFLHVDVVGL